MKKTAPGGKEEALRRALYAIQDLRRQVDAMEGADHEPIAVIGMGCRYPGGVSGPDRFWERLREGFDAVIDVPSERWDAEAYFDPDPDAPGKTYTRCGSFVDDADQFDPGFFGISPREAAGMDPQHRLVLEVAWEALEHAGVPPHGLEGSRVGVFVGITANDYLHVAARDIDAVDPYTSTGNMLNFAAGRLSFVLGLQGPCMSVDAACASSLVTVHLACQSLRARECDLAMAGGVNLTLLPYGSVLLGRTKILAPDGRCKSFDAAADGMGRGEGCGVIVLKRLSAAERDNDRVLALLLGSSVSQDGHGSGLTAPNPLAQADVILQALDRAGIQPADVDYIEAHGTGTELGDPIEIDGLARVFGSARPSDDPLVVGSIKTNIGHLESAAGIAGLSKLVLSLQHAEIPPHLHFHRPNPRANWDAVPIRIPTESIPWPQVRSRRIGGVSAFGLSGTIAHVVTAEAPTGESAPSTVERPLHVLPLSARTKSALREVARRYAGRLAAMNGERLADVCYTAGAGRSHFTHRLAVVGDDPDRMAEQLDAFASDGTAKGVVAGVARAEPPRIAFLFTGQGSQYPGMGATLYDTQPIVRRTVDRCAEVLDEPERRAFVSRLFGRDGGGARLTDTEHAQPALYALESAIAAMFDAWGIQPTAVMGHSVGEFAAASHAGLFPVEDGMRLVATRGRLMQELPRGAMAAVLAEESAVSDVVESLGEPVALACINGPRHVVISGSTEDVDRAVAELTDRGFSARSLDVSHAFHSAMMEPMLDLFEQAAEGIDYEVPRCRIVSNVTGTTAGGSELAQAAYWRRHVREPVRFRAGVEQLVALGCSVFVEMGPQPVLCGMAGKCVSGDQFTWLPTLRRGREEWQTIGNCLARLYVAGAAIDWEGFDRGYVRRKITLPTYPFERERCWVASRDAGGLAVPGRLGAIDGSVLHPLLARRVRSPSIEGVSYEAVVSWDRPSFLRDHQVGGFGVFPATAYAEMALAAARAALPAPFGSVSVEELSFLQPMTLDDGARSVDLSLSADGNHFTIASLDPASVEGAEAWTTHAEGRLRWGVTRDSVDQMGDGLQALRARCTRNVDCADYYRSLCDAGLEYGPTFCGLRDIQVGDGEALGRVELASETHEDVGRYIIHPGLLDACFQLAGATAFPMPTKEASLFLPVRIERILVHAEPGAKTYCHAVVEQDSATDRSYRRASFRLFDEQGNLTVDVKGLEMVGTDTAFLQRSGDADMDRWFYEVEWHRCDGRRDRPTESIASRRWLVFVDDPQVGQPLAAALVNSGAACRTLNPSELKTSDDAGRIVHEGVGDGNEMPVGIVYDCRSYTCLLHLVQALVRMENAAPVGLWLTTHAAQSVGPGDEAPCDKFAALWGFARSVAAECPGLAFRRIDLPSAMQPEDVSRWIDALRESGQDWEYAIRGGDLYVSRLEPRTPFERGFAMPAADAFRMRIRDQGVIGNLRVEAVRRRPPGPGEVEIRVRAAGLNFRDVLGTLGVYPGDPGPPGNECAGTVTAVGADANGLAPGDEVVALGSGCFASHVTLPASLVAPKPDGLGFDEAAGLPVVWLTAYYCLHRVASMGAGSRVLIHAAAGGVGQAAVRLAQECGAEIFATAGNPRKRAFLRALGVRHVMDSRATGFSEEIHHATGGDGVDIVLNSLTGDAIREGLDALRPGGSFVEIGKTEIWDTDAVRNVRPDVRYSAVALDEMIVQDARAVGDLLRDVMGTFTGRPASPFPMRVFPVAHAADAFHLMAQARHVGKLVLAIPDSSDAGSDPPAIPISPRGVYLITGGLGSLGLHTADWLVRHGARALILVSRRAPSDEAQHRLQSLRDEEVSVTVRLLDVSDAAAINDLVAEAHREHRPLRGLVHAAGVLRDAGIDRQTEKLWADVSAPKVQGAWNLHRATRNLPLDFFILYSSAAALLGSPGQANYAAANSALDALARHRWNAGLPATSIQWGPWSDSGMAAATNARDRQRRAAFGLRDLEPSGALKALGWALRTDRPVVGVFPIDWRRFAQPFPPDTMPAFFDSIIAGQHSRAQGNARNSIQPGELVTHVRQAPASKQRDVLTDYLREQAARILGMQPTQLADQDQPLNELGMDSLMAVELRNTLAIATGQTLSAGILFRHPSIGSLSDYLADEVLRLSQQRSGAPAGEEEDADRMAVLEEIAQLSDQELDAELSRLVESFQPVDKRGADE